MKLKQILVALDLSKMDDRLIEYASYMDEFLNFDTVYFFHVAKTFEYPEKILEDHPELLAPLDETIKYEIEDVIKDKWKDKSDKIQIKVVEGNPEEEVLKWAKIKSVDLIVLGRKIEIAGSGLVPGKVTRAASCSVLLVPEFAQTKLSKVMLSVDFSRHSRLVAEQCLNFSRVNKDIEIIFYNVYHVPLGYSKTGKTYEEFAKIMEGHAHRDMADFKGKLDIGNCKASFVYECDNDHRPMDQILKYAYENDVDLLAVGSKGRTNAASFLLGSLAERLVNENDKIPFLVVKQKGSNMGFLEALFKL